MRYNSQLTREKINQAAIELFVLQGVDATTTKQIAQRAKVAEGSLYRHYASKQELVSSLYREHHLALSELLQQRSASANGAIEALHAMTAAVFESYADEQTRHQILFLLLAQHSEALTQNLDFETLAQLVESTIIKGQRQGQIRVINPVLAGALVIGMVAQCIEYLALEANLGKEEAVAGVQTAISNILEVSHEPAQ